MSSIGATTFTKVRMWIQTSEHAIDRKFDELTKIDKYWVTGHG
jgi:hypothetical protein